MAALPGVCAERIFRRLADEFELNKQRQLREGRRRQGKCSECARPAVRGLKRCQRCLDLQGERTRRYIAKKRAENPRPPRLRQWFRSKQEVFDAIDDASDGMLVRFLALLDDGSPVLRELAARWNERSGERRIYTWADAVMAVVPPGSRRWRDVDQGRLEDLSESMHEGLTAGGGGINDLERARLGFPGLQLPLQTQRILENEKWLAEGEDFEPMAAFG